MKVKEMLELINGKLLSSPEHLEYDVSFGVASDLISDVLMCVKDSAVLFTGLVNHQIVRVAEMVDMQAVVFVRGKKPNAEILALAEEHDLPILCTKFSLFEACAKSYQGGLKALPIKVSIDE